jgi:hypothetical protein
MANLVNRLQEEESTVFNMCKTPVNLQKIDIIKENYKLNKPTYAVVDMQNNRAIHLHGANYQLIPYDYILYQLSDALDDYGIDISNTNIQFSIHEDLNYMKLRILFGDDSAFKPYSMSKNDNDKLRFGIELISSYDASLVFTLRAMFVRLICANGMTSFEDVNSSIKRHTKKFDVDTTFEKLRHLNKTFTNMSNRFEVYNHTDLTSADVDILFKKFAGKNESKYNLLLKVLETPKDKSTLYDVYNALTNYSSHNQRAVRYASKIKLTGGHEDYKLDNCKKDSVRSAEDRDFEVTNFIKSNTFVYYYHKGLANYSKQISQ